MSDFTFEGMAIADGVVETIVAMAVQEVQGVAAIVGSSTTGRLAGRLTQKPAVKGVEVLSNEDDSVAVAVRIVVTYGYPLPSVADAIREAVADAMLTQIGLDVSNVDVYVDGIQFS